ncbi:MAG: O-antigen ligase family protein [Sulfuricurvum sp.]|nr:O-antigen ligase family protein [Sulfuricurvum sp.]
MIRTKITILKSFENFQLKSTLFANYLLILYAFFLPISNKIATNILIGVAIFTLFGGNLREKFSNAIQDKIIISFFLFYMMYFIWLIGSEHTLNAFFKLKEFKYIIEISLIIYIVLQKEFVYKILGGFISGMLFSEIMSYCLFFDIPISLYFPFITLKPVHTNVPFMGNHTAYTICLSISISIILYKLLTHQVKNKYLFFTYLLFFTTASVNIFIIYSRLGYILYGINILFTLIFVYRKQFLKTIFIFTMITSTTYTLAFYYSPFFKDRTLAAMNDFKSSLNASYNSPGGIRIGYYVYAWEVIKEHPIFGVGTGDHISEVIKVVDQQETSLANKEALYINYKSGYNASFDSEYLDILVQFGIIGLIVFFNILFQIRSYEQNDRQLKFLQYLLILTMCIIAGPSLIFIPAEVGKTFILLLSLTLAIKPLNFTSAQRST